MTSFKAIVAMIVLGSVMLAGCKDSNRAGRKAFRALEEQVDVDGVQRWAKSIIESSNPEKAFALQGKAIPTKLLKFPEKPPPQAELVQFGTGEWTIQFNVGFGLEYYGIAMGRENARFPSGYKVYLLKPGIYYFYTSF